MPIKMKTRPEVQAATDAERLAQAHEKLRDQRYAMEELERENQSLRDQLEGNIPSATYWLQRKVWRQRTWLDRLERRVRSQRLQLRLVNRLGRGLTAEEWREGLASLTDQEQERIKNEPVL